MYALKKHWRALAADSFAKDLDESLDNRIQVHSTGDEAVIIIGCLAKHAALSAQWKLTGGLLSLHDHAHVRRTHDWRGGILAAPNQARTNWEHEKAHWSLEWARSSDVDSDLVEQFNSLVSKWREDTSWLSSMSKKLMHPAYLRIIGLGPAVLPLLLRELEQRPSYWFTALSAVSGVDPASGSTSFDEAVEAWIKWGRQKGLL